MAQNPFYVYALKDPRYKPTKPFYIGKGTGNRAWEHQAQIDDSDKGRVIREIHEAGFKVLHTVISDNLTEEQALKIEAELTLCVKNFVTVFYQKLKFFPSHTYKLVLSKVSTVHPFSFLFEILRLKLFHLAV